MPLLSALAALALQSTAPAPAAHLHKYDGLALSPAGDRLATVESDEVIGSAADVHGVLTVRSSAGAVLAKYDPCPACKYDGAAWSPDGAKLAFFASDAKAGTATLYVLENGKTRSVATVKGVANHPRWSPDGKTIAVLATPAAHKETGATQAGARQVGEIGASNVTDEQRIAIVAATGGELRFLSPADTFVYEYDWTPDSQGFVGTAAKGDGDNNWWVASLQSFTLAGEVRIITAPKLQMNAPKVSPDGKSVMFIGGIMSDFGSVGGDLYTVPLSGGEPANLTPGFNGTFTSLLWPKSGPVATVIVGGETGVARIDPNSGKVNVMSHAEVYGSAGDAKIAVDANGKLAAAVVESFTQAPRLEVGPLGAAKPVTHENDAVTLPFQATSLSWKSGDYTAQGWLLAPSGVKPGKTYPMITVIHGGPSAATLARFSGAGTVYELLKAGYFVFEPNPRGSYGQGEAFTRANIRDFGGGDLSDILAGIDAVEKVAPVDDARLGVYGHSYGGYMTMWTVTHSQRFKAAVAGAGIANWISYYGENGIDQWMIPFFGGSAYDDPAIYDQLSPIRSIKAAKTPTFIYVGERDVECPAAQSLEFWHGLKAQGVETSLVIYDGEGHGIRKPEHKQDLSTRILGWFSGHLGAP